LSRRIFSWQRPFAFELGSIANKIHYNLAPYIGGAPVGGRNAFIDPKHQDQIVREYRKAQRNENRIAVVSCISGAYDLLLLPHRLLPNADYLCFSDRPQHDWGVFQIRPIDFIHADPIRSARFLKTHLHHYLSNYDTVIWLDANAVVRGDLQVYVDTFLRSGKAFAAVPHPFRDSVYEEAEACKAEEKDDPRTIDAQVARYRREGFDCDDLIESNFFICRPNDEPFRRFCDFWWSEIDRHSRRDQLSINYALHKTRLERSWLLKKGENLRDHPDFRLVLHNSLETEIKRISWRFGEVINP